MQHMITTLAALKIAMTHVAMESVPPFFGAPECYLTI
jgi:hypothetical protein